MVVVVGGGAWGVEPALEVLATTSAAMALREEGASLAALEEGGGWGGKRVREYEDLKVVPDELHC